MPIKVGKANYTANTTNKTNYYRLSNTVREIVVRIAPPVGDLAEESKFAVYHKQHFGYDLPIKDKSIPVTFNCIEQRSMSRAVTQPCPECDEIAFQKKALEELKASLKDEPNDVQEARTRPMVAWLKKHNRDQKWALYAKNEAGTWGILTISHNAYKDLMREIKEVQALGYEDPLSHTEGVWFKFTRSGEKFNEIKDTCTVVKVNQGKGQFAIKQDTMTETDFAALEAMPPLLTLGRKLTYEQVVMLVQSGGDAEVVKSVFDSAETSPTETARTTTPAKVASTTVDALSAAVANLAPAPKAAVATPAPVVGRQPSATVKADLDMDIEEFKRKFATPE
jgi:hypothetical protein